MTQHDEQWRVHGACARTFPLNLLGLIAAVGLDPDLWFPEQGGGAIAARVCAGCPVRSDCLMYAVDRREEFGIWGGAGELTRRHLTRLLAGRTVWLWLFGLPAEVSVRPHRRVFLIEVQDHFDRLDDMVAGGGRMPEGQANSNGVGATHGRASTYARGCRCDACRDAIRESQRRNRRRRLLARGAVADGEVG